MLDGLVDQKSGLLPSAYLPEQRHECGFACMGVPPGRLACRYLIAAMINEIIGDLESEAHVACVTAIGRPRVLRHPRHDAGRLDGIFDERARLELLEARDGR